mmetsp:Transcript_14676/g.50685  ORF Transcript_14676/g.50685 Transcript_14676/m.50685 type:complete len:202 (+) Transcript_14676:193-798(+)
MCFVIGSNESAVGRRVRARLLFEVREHRLGLIEALCGCEREPSSRLVQVLRATFSSPVGESKIFLGHCLTPVRGHPKQLHRLLLVQLELSGHVHESKTVHRVRVPELDGALVNLRRLLSRLHEAVVSVTVTARQMSNCFGNEPLGVSSNHRQFIHFPRRATERTRLFDGLFKARQANPPAATSTNMKIFIHVPVLEADRAP